MTADATFSAIAFSGSLRADSSNTGLVRLAARLAPSDLHIEVVNDLVFELPFYNADLEEAVPPVVQRWRDVVAAADALIVGMPEYNFLPSAVAKNAIDWATRPYGGQALQGKVIAMLTSAGKGGGANVQDSIGPILGMLGNTVVDEPRVQIVLGMNRIQSDGTTTDPEVETLVVAKLTAVVDTLKAKHA